MSPISRNVIYFCNITGWWGIRHFVNVLRSLSVVLITTQNPFYDAICGRKSAVFLKSMPFCLQKWILNHICSWFFSLCRGVWLLWSAEAALQETGGQHLPWRPRGDGIPSLSTPSITESLFTVKQPSFASRTTYLRLHLCSWHACFSRSLKRKSISV